MPIKRLSEAPEIGRILARLERIEQQVEELQLAVNSLNSVICEDTHKEKQ